MIDNIIAADTMLATLTRLLHQEWLTPVDALEKARCFSLSQRCGQLRRQGFNVLDKWVELPSGKRVKAYHIADGKMVEPCYFAQMGELHRAKLSRDRLAMEKL